MFGLSLFRPSRHSNISTSGEDRFKYPLPWENKIVKCPTPGPTKTIKSSLHALQPSARPRHNIDRCIRFDEFLEARERTLGTSLPLYRQGQQEESSLIKFISKIVKCAGNLLRLALTIYSSQIKAKVRFLPNT